jgi:hypothetical protein
MDIGNPESSTILIHKREKSGDRKVGITSGSTVGGNNVSRELQVTHSEEPAACNFFLVQPQKCLVSGASNNKSANSTTSSKETRGVKSSCACRCSCCRKQTSTLAPYCEARRGDETTLQVCSGGSPAVASNDSSDLWGCGKHGAAETARMENELQENIEKPLNRGVSEESGYQTTSAEDAAACSSATTSTTRHEDDEEDEDQNAVLVPTGTPPIVSQRHRVAS